MKFFIILTLCIVTIWAKHAPVLTQKRPIPRIIGGKEARVGQYPFAVALNVQTSNAAFFCGGALLSNEWILTSGHCVSGAVTATAHIGSNKLSGTDPNRVTASSSHFVIHPDFNAATNANDIGLIKLRMPIEFSAYIQPIRLPIGKLPNSAVPTAIGWGQTNDDDGDLASDLQYVGLGVVSNDECKFVFGNIITDSIVCAEGNFNEGTCLGDSGSPLVVRLIGGTVLYHVGISSFYSGNGCESTDPSGFTRTFSYVDWIKKETGIQ